MTKIVSYTKIRKNETAEDSIGFEYAIRVDGFVIFWYRENPAGPGYYAELAYGVAEQLGPELTAQVNGLYQFVGNLKENARRIACLLAGEEDEPPFEGVEKPNQK